MQLKTKNNNVRQIQKYERYTEQNKSTTHNYVSTFIRIKQRKIKKLTNVISVDQPVHIRKGNYFFYVYINTYF